jgi:hypothetical protein
MQLKSKCHHVEMTTTLEQGSGDTNTRDGAVAYLDVGGHPRGIQHYEGTSVTKDRSIVCACVLTVTA